MESTFDFNSLIFWQSTLKFVNAFFIFFDCLVFFFVISSLCSILLFILFFVFSLFSFMSFPFLFSFLVIGSCPFSSISVSLCLLFSNFRFFLYYHFASSLLATHCREVIILGVSLMYFKSLFKISISSFVKNVILSSLVFVFFLPF